MTGSNRPSPTKRKRPAQRRPKWARNNPKARQDEEQDEERVLFCERLSIQYFLVLALRPALAGIFPILLITLLGAIDFYESFQTPSTSNHPHSGFPSISLRTTLWGWTVVGVSIWLIAWALSYHHKSKRKKEAERKGSEESKKKAKRRRNTNPSAWGLFLILPLALLLLVDFLYRRETPNYPTLATPASLWGWTVVGMVVWVAIWGICCYQAFYIWQRTWLILTESFLKVERPSNRWLNIRQSQHDEVDSWDIHGFKAEAQTLLQQWLFPDSITVSVLVSALEGSGISPVEYLRYVKKAKKLQKGVEWIIARNNAVRQGA